MDYIIIIMVLCVQYMSVQRLTLKHWLLYSISTIIGIANSLNLNPSACGVAHQALEAIDPKGDNILVQGEYDLMGIFVQYM